MAKRTAWKDLGELTEQELRLNIILPLLRKTPGIQGVTDLHGKFEKGLDVLFYTEDAIGRTWYGLQLKRGNISGGAGKGTVREVVAQLELAEDFDHPMPVGDGGRHRIDQFIVATSGNISDAAREEITSRKSEIPVRFWDGHELIRRINDYFPELLSGVDAELIDYLERVTDRCERLDALDTIPGIATRTLSDIYEPPKLRVRFDTGIVEQNAVRHPIAAVPALSLLSATRRSVIVADQNEGKTSLLRMLAITSARKALNGDGWGSDDRLPILLRARAVLDAASMENAARQEVAALGAERISQSLEDAYNEGTYFVAVDGFSELLSEAEKETCQGLIVAFATKYPQTAVVVTGRPQDFLQPKYFTTFRHYFFEHFDERQVGSLINRWTKGVVTLGDVAQRMVGRVRDALQLPGSPIPAIIGVLLYEEEKRYITNTAEAVDRYMSIRLGRYAREMGIRQDVDWARKEDLVAELAFAMVEAEIELVDRDAIIRTFDERFERLGEKTRSEMALQELVDSGVLVRVDGMFAFHRSAFRDFFAAKHVFRHVPDFDTFVVDHFLDQRWGSVLVFALGLRRQNTVLLQRLDGVVADLRARSVGEPSGEYLYGSYLLGRLLSNSEACEAGTRSAVLRTCLRASAESIEGFEAVATEQFGPIGQLAALIGVEHTFFITVGVPWLENQFRELALDSELSEEERFIVASAFANVGGENCFQLLEEAISSTDATQVLLVLQVLLLQLREERKLSHGDGEAVDRLEAKILRKLNKRQKEVKEILKIRSKLIELEANRVRRLTSKS